MQQDPPPSTTRFLALALFLVAVVAAVPARPGAAETEEAEKPVVQLEKALEAVQLEGAELSFIDRYKRLARIVARTHAIENMAEARVGVSWRTLEEERRKTLKDLLYKRIVASFALRFDGLTELELARGSVREDVGGGRQVETLIEVAEGPPTVLTFRVRPFDEGWRIVNLALDPNDDPLVTREASSALLAKGGPDALEKAWKDRIPLPEQKPDAPTVSPREVIDRLQKEIIAVMKAAEELGYEGRVERFRPVVEETHHLPAIAQLTLRRYWKSLTDEQRTRFMEVFSRFAIARYAGRFDGYSGERFENLGEEESRKSKILHSVLVKSDGEKVTFDWTLRESKEGWKILNITVDGVSDLATKQAEYTAIMEQKGFAGLIQTVEDQILRQKVGE